MEANGISKGRRNEIIHKILCGTVLFAVLILSTVLLGQISSAEVDMQKVGTFFGLAAAVSILYEVIQLVFHLKTKEKSIVFRVTYIVFYVAVSVLAFLSLKVPLCFFIGVIVYLSVPILKRVASIVRNRSRYNITINILVGIFNLLFIFLAAVLFGEEELKDMFLTVIIGVVMMGASLINVGFLVFSNFNLKLLKKIAKKTYAGETILGLLLLMIAFSIAFIPLEDSIHNFSDALWYCFAIITTIGFGDIVATTVLGRMLSVFLGIYGIIVVSIITSIIINFYNEVRDRQDGGEEVKEVSENTNVDAEKPEDSQKKEDTREKIE